MRQATALLLPNLLNLTLQLLLVTCAQNAKSVYPEVSDPFISKRSADSKLELFERTTRERKESVKQPKNAILFIGDGMGISTITGARYLKAQDRGLAAGELRLDWENWPAATLVATYSANRMTTDSAASATAFLCGAKTAQDAVGVAGIPECCICQDPKSTIHVYSSLILAQRAGLSTGIVTTTRVTDATPAAAYAHSTNRYWQAVTQYSDKNKTFTCPDIASQLITEGMDFNVILAGGYDSFYQHPDLHTPKTAGRRTDGRNLLKEWKEQQRSRGRRYKLIFNRTALFNSNELNTDYLLGLFSSSHMDYDIQRTDQPSLSEMTSKAIMLLSRNPKGFLLLVEGGRIDHGHHVNMAKFALTDTLALEKAVSTAVRETNPEETLIMVTADHSHGYGILGYATRGQHILDIEDTSKGEDGLHYLISSYFSGPGAKINQSRDDPLKMDRMNDTAMQQSLIPLKYGAHTGEDVALYATGPMHQLFRGAIDNTYIAFATMYSLCLGSYENASHCMRRGKSNTIKNCNQPTTSIFLNLILTLWLYAN